MQKIQRLQTILLFLLLGLFFFALTVASSFASEVDPIVGDEISIKSDGTWKFSRIADFGWTSIDFNDGLWGHVVAPSNGVCGVFEPTPHIADPMWASNPVQGESIYFRKKFTLTGPPRGAIIQAVFDDDGDVYVNGSLVLHDRSGTVNMTPLEQDVTSLLHEGDNVIALYAIDTATGCQSAQVAVNLEVTYENHILEVPLFKQTNNAWSNDIYAGGLQDVLDCGSSVGACGCAVSSSAMILQYHGASRAPNGSATSPKALNDYFKQGQKCTNKGCVSLGYAFGALRWAAIDQYTNEANRKFGTQKVEWVDRTIPDINSIKEEIRNNNPVALRSADGTHWFVGKGILNNAISINDPYFNRTQLDDPAYENRASAMVRFQKTNSDFRLIQVITPPGQKALVVDKEGRRAGYDIATNSVYEEIPHSTYQTELPVFNPSQSNLSGAPAFDTAQKEIAVITIKASESADFSIDMNQHDGSDKFVTAIYASNQNGDLEQKVAEGEFLQNGKTEVTLQYDPSRTGEFLNIDRPVVTTQSKNTKQGNESARKKVVATAIKSIVRKPKICKQKAYYPKIHVENKHEYAKERSQVIKQIIKTFLSDR